jgi:uncharacterized damage-inducible protein DinB
VDKQELSAALRQSRAALLAPVRGMSQDAAVQRPTDDEWSVIEVLAHMVDVDYYYLGEALAMRDSAGHAFCYFDDDAWKRTHPEVRRLPLERVLAALDISHQTVLAMLAASNEEQLSTPGTHPRGIDYTARDVFYRLVPHDETHEQQIRQILRAI